jgi:hypothetical protein
MENVGSSNCSLDVLFAVLPFAEVGAPVIAAGLLQAFTASKTVSKSCDRYLRDHSVTRSATAGRMPCGTHGVRATDSQKAVHLREDQS